MTRRRGGYCFEQNALFLRALRTMGFTARPLLARVWLDAGDTPGKTHTLNLARIGNEDWIADAGFGGSYTPPMRLRDGDESGTPDGARHRLRRDDAHWMLERRGEAAHTDGRGAGAGWVPQYSFTLAEVWPADLAMSNHWTSTAPDTRFLDHRVVSIALPKGFASLLDRHYSRTNSGQRSSGEIASGKAYRLRLSLMFGIDLAADDVDALGLFAGTDP